MNTLIGMNLKRKLLKTVWPRQCERDILRALDDVKLTPRQMAEYKKMYKSARPVRFK